jgi:hypothetical protein
VPLSASLKGSFFLSQLQFESIRIRAGVEKVVLEE